MTFRVTNQMIANQTMRNINMSLGRLETHNRHLSTGKRISLPSDDPTGTEVSMRLRSSIQQTEQHLQNVEDAMAWLHTTDAALGQVTDILHRARSLVIDGANGDLTDDARQALAVELDQLVQDAVQVGNLKQGNKYLFSGTNTLTQPFAMEMSADGSQVLQVNYQGTPAGSDGLSLEIGPGMTMSTNTHGDTSIFPAINALIAARDRMAAGDTAGLSEESIVEIDEAMDVLLTARAHAGARTNRLELVKQRMEDGRINLTRLLSAREDVDVAEEVMKLKMEENVYRLALASGARVIQPTLLDFLR